MRPPTVEFLIILAHFVLTDSSQILTFPLVSQTSPRYPEFLGFELQLNITCKRREAGVDERLDGYGHYQGFQAKLEFLAASEEWRGRYDSGVHQVLFHRNGKREYPAFLPIVGSTGLTGECTYCIFFKTSYYVSGWLL